LRSSRSQIPRRTCSWLRGMTSSLRCSLWTSASADRKCEPLAPDAPPGLLFLGGEGNPGVRVYDQLHCTPTCHVTKVHAPVGTGAGLPQRYTLAVDIASQAPPWLRNPKRPGFLFYDVATVALWKPTVRVVETYGMRFEPPRLKPTPTGENSIDALLWWGLCLTPTARPMIAGV
jgi:hypothetical protein